MPVGELRQAVEVLVELPREPRLADPRDAGHRDELRAALVRRRVEQILDPPQLAVASDERRLEAGRLERSAGARDDAQRLPERRLPFLALQLERSGDVEDDRLLRGAPGRLAHEDGSRLRGGLDARRGVDEVARDHALAARADGDGGLAGEDACPGAQLGCADLVPERRDRGDEVERRPDGPFGVVLRGDGRSPDGHHRVADELLDRPAVQLDEPAARVEVAREQLARVLCIAALRGGGEPDEVGEQHGHEPSLRLWRSDCDAGPRRLDESASA